jgi:hypothetical protein
LTIDDERDHARVFVSNVLNGTVTRLDLAITASTVTVKAATVIASGYTSQENDVALILGPTGLAYDQEADVLFVASAADNMIFAVPNAGARTGSSGKGAIIFKDDHLRGPLALVFTPNGDLLTANGDAVNDDPTQPSEIVEFTRTGRFVRQFNVDAAQGRIRDRCCECGRSRSFRVRRRRRRRPYRGRSEAARAAGRLIAKGSST